jgi:hypothetical protein
MTKPTQRIFYAVCILAIILIALWGVIFNKAYLIVTAEDNLPFSVSVGNQTYTCLEQCEIELTPRSYQVLLSRDGYSSFESRLFLTRGRTQELNYTPIFLPVFTALNQDQIIQFDEFRFLKSPENPDQQIFQINTGEDFRTVSTFRLPLENPNAVLSYDYTQAFIWSGSSENENQTEIEYYLVDINNESRQRINLNLPSNSIPSEYKLLNNNQLLLKQNSLVYLSDLISNDYIQFPVSTVNHVSIIEDGAQTRTVLLTDRNVSGGGSTVTPQAGATTTLTQILELTDTEDEDLLAEKITTRPDKIFAYLPETKAYQFLGAIPQNVSYPFEFQTVIYSSDRIQVLTSQQESFQIILSQN